MSKLPLGITALALGLSMLASAQTRSSAGTIGLQANVPATLKIVPGEPTCGDNVEAFARSTANDRIEITVTMKGRDSFRSIRVPLKVITNARSYLFRVSSLVEGASGTIRAEARASLSSREHALNANRVFALASNAPGALGQQDFINVQLSTPLESEARQVRIEIQAVPQ